MSRTDDLILPIGAVLYIPGPQTTRVVLGDMAYALERGRAFRPDAPLWFKLPNGQQQMLRPRGDVEAAELEEMALELYEQAEHGGTGG